MTWHPNFRIVDTADIAPLPEAAEIVARLDEVLSGELNAVLVTLPEGFATTKALVRTEETAMGNLIADATRVATGFDVALVNSGSIRGDKVYAAGHELTARDVLTELPFGNTTYVIEVSGQTLRDALENSVSQLEDKAGRFLQVSGVGFEYDPSAAAGTRVIAATVGDAPLDDASTYSIAINNYLYGGGDGYTMFENALLLVGPVGADTVSNQVIAYLQSGQVGTLGVECRIVALAQERASEPPTATFEAKVAGLTVSFTDGSTDPGGQITAWAWDFGDGATSTEQNPAHGYAAGGLYAATLSVTDNSGEATDATFQVEILATAGQISTVLSRIGHSLDDAEETRDGGAMYMDSSDLEFVNDDHVNGDQIIGMRFEALAVPQGAEITEARLTFEVDEPSGADTALTIRGEATGDAQRFAMDAGDISRRPLTEAAVDWLPEPWIQIGASKTTPDLSTVITEIVQRDDWAEGNAIVLIVTGQGLRTAAAFDGDPGGAPALSIDFVVPE
ncbi:5'-nucleotidase C-terminal domain-containing protein [Yoonia litorea]|uniref:PKD domain-containing protein n=1 Tax=Yoonia litorea TaxID=1123755 RepID=A0A1I6ME29_9RHOB|nr:5'-nucleotidase C-terminal domain-containing protein [Yoonia litorea]SFS13965.1 PKD domain-containing protein [Yoonia litorea]